MNKLQRIQEIEKQLVELKKQVEAEQKQWPQTGDAVWWLSTEGEIDSERFYDSSYDSERLARGYFFKTREEAVEADRKRVAEVAYKNKIKEVNGDWKPGCGAMGQARKHLYYSWYLDKVVSIEQLGADMILDYSEYFTPKATQEQEEELKRLYAEWRGIDYE